MRNKKGFTLIELLVVIALMLSILAIAIINFVNVSNKKKEESWERVKEQTELAAEEYFGAYKYYLENLNKADDYARVSIGKLVEEDYLNKVTNPLTGKSLNNCDYVEVTLGTSGNDYVYKYTQNNTNSECNANSYVIVSEVGAPKISVDITKGTKNNNYYVTDVDITATIETGGNGAIKSVKYCTSSNDCTASNNLTVKTGKKNNYKVTNYSLTNNTSGIDGNKVTTYFVATNTSDKKVIGSVTYKKDTEKPKCGNPVGSSTTWTKGSRTINQYCTDETSGCTKDNYKVSFNKTTKIGEIKIEDKAGNYNYCNPNVYVDNTKPKCGIPNGSSTVWTNQNRTITQECDDGDGSGCKAEKKEYKTTKKTDTITIKDGVGNTNTCNVNVYVDKGVPEFTVNLYKEESKTGTLTDKVYKNNTWYNKYVYTKVSISNKTTSGIESTTYTTTGATKNESNKSGSSRHINAEKKSYITYKVCNNAGTCKLSDEYTIKLDHTPPIITYLDGPKAKSCDGKAGVYVKYKVSDELSGIEEVYHYFGEDKEKKSYDEVSKYKIEIDINNQYEDTVERIWAVGNPKGCDSPNTDGPGTALCYVNNTAVKDKAGNTATGVSSSCSKVGKN